MICLSCLLIILHWILSAKNHTVFLAASIWSLECHSQQRDHTLSLSTWHSNCYQLSIQLIFQTSSFYYSSFGLLQPAHSINQLNQLSLSSRARQLFSSISSFFHAQFLLIQSFFHSNFFWFKLSCSFLIYFFVWLISFSHLRFWSNLLSQTAILSHVMLLSRDFLFALFLIMFCLFVSGFSQVYLYKLLFNLMQHFWKDFLFAFLNIWSHAAFLKKILFSSSNFNTEASISLAFVYYEW